LAKLIECTETEYHADEISDEINFSASCAHTIVTKSAAHAYLEHPRLGGMARAPTDAMAIGTIVHQMILGGQDRSVIIDHPDYKKKVAREERDEAREEGLIPILHGEFANLYKAVPIILEKFERLGVHVYTGKAEQTILWKDMATTTGVEINCKSRIDWISPDCSLIIDLKTTASAHPTKCARAMTDFSYCIQNEAYRRALGQLVPDVEGRVKMMFMFCELKPPYCVTPMECAGSMREVGKARWQRGLNVWDECMETGVWTDYVTQTVRADAPPWVVSAETMEVK
jgi:hypothetical protein